MQPPERGGDEDVIRKAILAVDDSIDWDNTNKAEAALDRLLSRIAALEKERDRYREEAENRARWTARVMPQVREARFRRARQVFRLKRTIRRVKAASERDNGALRERIAELERERDELRAELQRRYPDRRWVLGRGE